MHTGQNSFAPENSLPQLAQVRWVSAFMDLTVLQPPFEPKPTARSTEWCKIGLHSPWQSWCPVPRAIALSIYITVLGQRENGKIWPLRELVEVAVR
jgi:hypothetical protein